MDIDKINGLLNIVKEAAGHPTKLSALGAMAMKELEGHAAEAKKEHDAILAKEAKEVAAQRQAELDKQAKAAKGDEAQAHLTSQPQEVKMPEPNKPIVRRAVPDETVNEERVEEEAHGA